MDIFFGEGEQKEYLLLVWIWIEKFEEKVCFNFNKSCFVFQFLGWLFVFFKIGNYQFKFLILFNYKSKDENKMDFQKLNDKDEFVEELKKYMIIGDKDIFIIIY